MRGGLTGRLCLFIVAVSMTLAIGAVRAHADSILWNNGAFSGPQGNYSNTAGAQELFEDFTIAGPGSIITGIFWQQHDYNTAVYRFTRVTVFDGLPYSAQPVFSADIVANRAPNATGTLFTYWDGFDYSIAGLSISLGPGTYWLGLNSSFFGERSGWDNTTGGPDTIPGFRLINSPFYPPPGTVVPGNLAFTLTGEVIPEPASLLLLAGGLGALGLIVMRRRK